MIVSHRRPTVKEYFRQQTVDFVDLSRFAGEWFVQGHTHLWIDRNKPNQIERYTLLTSEKIQVDFSFQKQRKRVHFQQKAWIADTQTNAHWHIQFVYPFWSDYLIVGLDAEYQWTFISVPNRSLLWIMTRQQHVSQEEYTRLVTQFAAQNYPTEKLHRVEQLSSSL